MIEIPTPNPEAVIHELRRELYWANLKIQQLHEELRRQRIKVLGPHSETLSDLQLELLADEEPGVTADEVEAEARREAIPNLAPRRERKPHPGRKPLPQDLPRVEVTIPCASQHCKECGAETKTIGYDESEVLDREPAKYFVRVTKREKRACPCCPQAKVAMPELAPRIVPKGLVSDSIVVDVLIGKYCDHLPLYRQSSMLERETSVEISRGTMSGWMMQVGDQLEPVVGVVRQDLLRSGYLQADETTVRVQMHDKRGADHQAYLWQYGKPGGEMVFDFQMSRERAGPAKFLAQWEGILQTDGYQAYENIGGPKLVHVGCWAHARRKFVDAVKVNPNDGEAIKMVVRMDALFLVDRRARQTGANAEQRLAERREHALVWVEEIHAECLKLAKTVLPKSTMGQAVNYTLLQWSKLRRIFEYGEVELSNNLAENSMRGVALGRKNWLHLGDQQAGPRVAAILSVVESCRRLGISARDYLRDILPGMGRRKLSEIPALTPARWAAGR